MGGPRALPLALLLLASPAVGTAVSGAPQAPDPCTVTIEVSRSHIEVHINSTSPGTASTTGNVTVDLPPLGERAVVSIQAAVDTGWPISVSPQTVQISGSMASTIPFALSVVVPPGTAVSTAVVTLVARAVYAGLQCTSPPLHEPTVQVLPYVEDVVATADAAVYSVPPSGSPRTATLSLGSRSNADVVYHLLYEPPSGVSVTGPDTVAGHYNGGYANSSVTLRVWASGAEEGIYPVTVRVEATAQGTATSAGRATLPVEVSAASVPGAGLVEVLLAVAVAGVALPGSRPGRGRRIP